MVKATLLSIITNICDDFILVKISSCTVKGVIQSARYIYTVPSVKAGFSQNAVISCSIQIIWGGDKGVGLNFKILGHKVVQLLITCRSKGEAFIPPHPKKINDTKGYIITPNDMPLVNIANDDAHHAHICSIVNSVKSARITRR